MANHHNRATKPAANNVDIFLVIVETLGVNNWKEEARAVFAHAQAESCFGGKRFLFHVECQQDRHQQPATRMEDDT
jgi:hypothetical protein